MCQIDFTFTKCPERGTLPFRDRFLGTLLANDGCFRRRHSLVSIGLAGVP
jgi:hypothetical protein